MCAADPTTLDTPTRSLQPPDDASPRPCVVVAWVEGAALEVIGAVAFVDRPVVLGRGAGDGGEPRAELVRQRPGHNEALAPLAAPWLSRRHLRLQAAGGRVLVELLGRGTMRLRGELCTTGWAAPGELVVLDDRALLLVTERPATLPEAPSWRAYVSRDPAWGEADRAGLVGESPAMWALRERVAFVASQRGHALVLGPSGVGKERVAQALHSLSERRDRLLVARNAATLPPGLVDAELFGNVANYPNPGMRERPGLIGAAHGSTLLLDEIGELPEEVQAHLLRVLDRGEYQRLGDATVRTSDLRVVAATNRPPDTLKPDLRARFRHVLRVPPLAERREDLPLLLVHLARRALSEDPALAARFAPDGPPRVATALVEAALALPLPLQVRELDAFLWDAIASSTGDLLLPPPSPTTPCAPSAPTAPSARALPEASPPAPEPPPPEPDADTLRACLERHGYLLERVWRELGLRNRYVLRRLMAKHGLRAPRAPHDA